MLENQKTNRPTAGNCATATAANIGDYHTKLANALATLLAVLARPAQVTQPAVGAVVTDRDRVRDQLSLLLREFERHLDFQIDIWGEEIYALCLSRFLRQVNPRRFRRSPLVRDLARGCAQVTAADVIPGALARAVRDRARDPDDVELARMAARVTRRAAQADRLRQRVERGLSKLPRRRAVR